MKKSLYEDPRLEVLYFAVTDILTASDGNHDGYIELPVDPL